MKVSYNITQNKFNANLNQETTEIKVKFQTGYYPLPGGGGGVVDTSNLVPYTGANKDVNIASNYFNTSKGFDFTKDLENYFKVSDNGDYNYLDFYTKDNSADNFGEVRFRVNPDEGFVFQKYHDTCSNTFQVTTDSTYSKKPFVSDDGFKTTTGTANQALTANGGVFDLSTKADLVGGKVPASQLPAYVDDVLEFANLASFPATGESGKIYIALDTNLTYRWGGSSYVVMSSSLALGETSSNAYRGDRGKIAYDHSQTTGNPHGTTKTDIGLGNVDNTSDLNKPISTAAQIELGNLQNSKQKKISVITIVGNTTLSEMHNGAVLNVTNTCNITVPTGLDISFQCVVFAKGAIIVTFVNSGVTIYAPSGLLLKQDKMASLICTSTNNYNLTGELATS